MRRRTFFGTNGQPIAGLDGFPDERIEYDAFGRPALLQLIADDPGIESIWTRLTYDARGEVTRIDYVSADRTIIDGKQGFATILVERAPDGSTARTIIKTAEGKVIVEQ